MGSNFLQVRQLQDQVQRLTKEIRDLEENHKSSEKTRLKACQVFFQ